VKSQTANENFFVGGGGGKEILTLICALEIHCRPPKVSSVWLFLVIKTCVACVAGGIKRHTY